MNKLLKNTFYLFKLLIVIFSFGFIAYKLFNQEQFEQIIQSAKNFNLLKQFVLFIVFILMIANWSVEALKWRLLIEKLQNINFLKSLKAIFSGITISIFTPNRTVEFAGRILSLKNENRVKAIFSTFIGSIAQLTITINLGFLAIGFIPVFYDGSFLNSIYTPSWLSILSILIIILITYFYFNIGKFKKFVLSIKFLKKYEGFYFTFFSYSKMELLKFLGLSLFRYLIFIVQFAILLWIFEVKLQFFDSVITLVLIYFTMTVIPTIALGEIGIRGSVSIFFLSKFTENLSAVFLASTSLWLINLALPALIGSILIYKSKIGG